jgi:hypothetical protein
MVKIVAQVSILMKIEKDAWRGMMSAMVTHDTGMQAKTLVHGYFRLEALDLSRVGVQTRRWLHPILMCRWESHGAVRGLKWKVGGERLLSFTKHSCTC